MSRPKVFDVARAFGVEGTDDELYDAWMRVKEPWLYEDEEGEADEADQAVVTAEPASPPPAPLTGKHDPKKS